MTVHDRRPDSCVRVFLVLPAMPRAIVTELLAREGDIAIVGAVSDLSDLDSASSIAKAADVVVVSGDGQVAMQAFEHLGYDHLPAIMAIDATGPSVVLHELIPRARALGDLSSTDFIEAVRAARAREGVL